MGCNELEILMQRNGFSTCYPEQSSVPYILFGTNVYLLKELTHIHTYLFIYLKWLNISYDLVQIVFI